MEPLQENAIAIIGVGYVGLPLALSLAKFHPKVLGYDIDNERVSELNSGFDRNNNLKNVIPSNLVFTVDLARIERATTYIITVPTPIDEKRLPDLNPLKHACSDVAQVISRGDLIIVESTVYPGVTEDVCGPLIQEKSGLKQGKDFFLGYSPERINPGDDKNTLEAVVKVIAAQDDKIMDRVKKIYEPVVKAGLFAASSIQTAEASKIVENIQRDLNVALMNELAIIFDKMNIRTADVLEAAGTKWNFQKFTPGLVGGHCIGVDPYYLISKAEALGYYPELIRAARRLNNSLADYVSQKTIDLLAISGVSVVDSRIGVLGMTFKENVSDLRNSQSPVIVNELKKYGGKVFAHDPYISESSFLESHGIDLTGWQDLRDLDAVLVIVPHDFYIRENREAIFETIKTDGIFIDVKSAFDRTLLLGEQKYWSL